MDANEVAQYLKSHPEFFEQYAELLSQIHIPSPHGDKAISITERQMVMLRDKAKQLEIKMAELIRFGEENDAIGDKVHELGVALTAAADLPAALRALYAHLGGAFAVPHVVVRLWSGSGSGTEFVPTADSIRAAAAALKHPYCGPSAGQETADWFGERGGHVRSLAQVPLRRGDETFGVLVLASEEAHRFYPEMGTLYLDRIGQMAAAALGRVAA
ncbi:MAG: DUF484 family protein [Gammaproteobacteria bacterium]|nr:DUF484 family protein [Gammaproteobacteria bacterium]MBU1645051.1 DUF484 family protein [Gammaproteobacteria bacterium]MBU1973288.1 DUF484 family protein [Gammaproteobacteria bacterium]